MASKKLTADALVTQFTKANAKGAAWEFPDGAVGLASQMPRDLPDEFALAYFDFLVDSLVEDPTIIRPEHFSHLVRAIVRERSCERDPWVLEELAADGAAPTLTFNDVLRFGLRGDFAIDRLRELDTGIVAFQAYCRRYQAFEKILDCPKGISDKTIKSFRALAADDDVVEQAACMIRHQLGATSVKHRGLFLLLAVSSLGEAMDALASARREIGAHPEQSITLPFLNDILQHCAVKLEAAQPPAKPSEATRLIEFLAGKRVSSERLGKSSLWIGVRSIGHFPGTLVETHEAKLRVTPWYSELVPERRDVDWVIEVSRTIQQAPDRFVRQTTQYCHTGLLTDDASVGKKLAPPKAPHDFPRVLGDLETLFGITWDVRSPKAIDFRQVNTGIREKAVVRWITGLTPGSGEH